MAALSDEDRAELSAEYNREISNERVPCGITKADIRAAVNALDTFLNDNAAAINSAIPQPARGTLTTAEKARLLKLVITRRYIAGA